ncbi:hypothetical protein ACP4OV_014416 [Aristida adscensionis]
MLMAEPGPAPQRDSKSLALIEAFLRRRAATVDSLEGMTEA